VTNLLIRPTAGGARGWAYVAQSDGAGFVTAGLYRDEFARTPSGWRIRERTYLPGTTWPAVEREPLPQAANRGPALAPSDYWDMKHLVNHYNVGYDNAGPFDEGRMSVEVFLPEAVFERIGAMTRTGLDMIADQSKGHKPLLHHWDAAFLISPVSDTETVSFSYDMQFNVEQGGAPVSLSGAGLLHHRFVRTPDGWRINYRRYEAVGSTPQINFPGPDFVPFVSRVPAAHAGKRGRGLSDADRVDLDQLYVRAALALDSVRGQGEDFAATFTPAGVLVQGTARAAGTAALAAVAAAGTPAVRSWVTNVRVEPTGPETARGRSHMLTMTIVGEAPGVKTAIRRMVETDDTLVRTAAGWRFARRTWTEMRPGR